MLLELSNNIGGVEGSVFVDGKVAGIPDGTDGRTMKGFPVINLGVFRLSFGGHPEECRS